jgi:hypothetical protein
VTEYIHNKGWGGKVRARIKFRIREKREPTEDEENGLDIPDPSEMGRKEVRQALEKGEEVSCFYQRLMTLLNWMLQPATLYVDLEMSGL